MILFKKMFLGLSIPKVPCNIGLSNDTYPKNIILNSIVLTLGIISV